MSRVPTDLRRRILVTLCGVVVALMTLAPTPGDVGGCQPARPLDESAFFQTKRSIDCERCQECGFGTDHCERACDDRGTAAERFLVGCAPLAHDGAVCLRALLAAPCSQYRDFVDDRSPQLPTECNFCPLEDRPGASP